MYYLQGQTMETIARHLGISRSSVSRLLSHARDTGLVRISVPPSPSIRGTLAGQISNLFAVNTSVVPVHDVHTEINRLHNVALVAAERLIDLMEPGATLGIAWGNTTSEITRCLPHVHFPGSTVVQLNGAATATESGVPYADAIISRAATSLGARMVHFPVPAFFDYASTKEAMWRERAITSVLKTIDQCTVALFGVGSMSARLPSHVYAGGFLEPEEIAAAQADGLVGDVCTVLLREDGSTDHELNQRASGPTPDTLKKIPKRLCAVAGASKALPLLAALRSGVVTDLVLDDGAARELLDLVRYKTQKHNRRSVL
ncbi:MULTISPECIES: sugar-binding transcriptional regulator [unclassified Schaalia]|uniref:sugar-binding transcriptional regulator n=1 Tax=unclassified Schaalia TaxID=2691889 RepID=UPI001E2F619F|nr:MULTISPECIES: sugar-binding domain-containing protein [unclassified Schaalia]MCD4548988.1 MarR family transcriptional regulator [Schaalia sp. lx-260]MCD4557599.1 MarR family transcriptional regulator [Schaalia sp. lx-100]